MIGIGNYQVTQARRAGNMRTTCHQAMYYLENGESGTKIAWVLNGVDTLLSAVDMFTHILDERNIPHEFDEAAQVLTSGENSILFFSRDMVASVPVGDIFDYEVNAAIF